MGLKKETVLNNGQGSDNVRSKKPGVKRMEGDRRPKNEVCEMFDETKQINPLAYDKKGHRSQEDGNGSGKKGDDV